MPLAFTVGEGGLATPGPQAAFATNVHPRAAHPAPHTTTVASRPRGTPTRQRSQVRLPRSRPLIPVQVLGREALLVALRGKRVAGLSPEAYEGCKDVNEA